MRIGQVYLPLNAARQQADPDALKLLERLEAAGIPVMELARGDEMRYNTTSVSVLWPVREHIRSGQDANESAAGPLHPLWALHDSQCERPFRRL